MAWLPALGLMGLLDVSLGFSAEPSAPTPPEFRSALPGYRFSFPSDHGAHPGFRTEWWYYTGHLQAEDGRPFGYQLTFFRRGLRRKPGGDSPTERSRWHIDDLYFAHLAVSDLQTGRFRFADVISREGLGKAGADEGRLRVWIDRWSGEASPSDDGLHRLVAGGDGMDLSLDLRPDKPPVVHGTGGVSRKGSGSEHASHYYSLTRLATSGVVSLDGRSMKVTGESWMDHEFGSGELSEDLAGWDWFSVQLRSGEELMLYRLRRGDGRFDPASSGTWVDRQGRARHLEGEAVRVQVRDHWTSPHSGAVYPSRWRVTIPALNADFEIVPLLADQELRTTRSTRITYWEGAVQVTGVVDHAPAEGRGYVELTGYADPYRPRR